MDRNKGQQTHDRMPGREAMESGKKKNVQWDKLTDKITRW